MKKNLLLSSVILLAVAGCVSHFKKRDFIYLVGSSTVSPLMAAVSEEFSRVQNVEGNSVKTPVVESTGTRNGFKFFCEGTGASYPDFINASRPIEKQEIENCAKNGVKNIVEIKIGYDGIVFGTYAKSRKISLTREQIFLALAQKVVDPKTKQLIRNPYYSWSDIDASLPDSKIKVYGPPLTSGTRDVFVDMVMEGACLNKKEFVAAIPDETLRKQQCHRIRDDGTFIESGENDNLIVTNLKTNPDSFGILGYDFLAANRRTIKAVAIDGVLPNPQSIASKKYALSRPLFVYFKKENIKVVAKIPEFIEEILNPETIGTKGYLVNNGLVAQSDAELEKTRKSVLSQINE